MDPATLRDKADALRSKISSAKGSSREELDDLDRLEQWIAEIESEALRSASPKIDFNQDTGRWVTSQVNSRRTE